MRELPGAEIEVEVDGVHYATWAEARLLLVDLLREEIGCRSVHVSCREGVCGACTVLLDGVPVRSCLKLAVQADGACVVTAAGLGGDAHAEALSALGHGQAFQCGYCAPGIMVLLTWELERTANPSLPALRELVGSQLCRCTGYESITEGLRRIVEARAAEPGHG